ncbi:hypothetical protein AK830_g7323 [Neonectria ditissima]|uniref:Uncharacterized protein n=1 Tax=Neonectria ditissima TaxID=78410 RepID=A0A0P7BAH0_9HYPO|nr:hypothetical protein AK830_g7323 [Neonectria ditissima]
MLSQIIRFTLSPPLTISTTEFLNLRRTVASAGATAQYYGYTVPTKSSPLPRKRHEICWTIQWPDVCDRSSVVSGLDRIATGDQTSVLVEFADSQLTELTKGLEALVCEFACIRLSDSAPLSDASLQKSMQKTYTDTYKIRGFTGGQWAYACNSNETSGVRPGAASEQQLPKLEQRFAIYLLGWDSIELHEDATKTPEFAEEISKLAPYFGPGTGAWYVCFRKH